MKEYKINLKILKIKSEMKFRFNLIKKENKNDLYPRCYAMV